MAKLLAALAAGAAVLILAVAGALLVWPESESGARSPHLVDVGGADLGARFTLTSHTGARVSSEELIDGPVLLYFGYTFCPDVCPIDAQLMVEATELLAEKGIDATPVFVTIDPERDTPAAMADYVTYMHPRMVGLTGSEAEIAEVADAFKVYYSKVQAGDSAAGYLMNHTAFVYLLTPEGVEGLFRHATPAEVMAEETARILGAPG